MLHRDARRKGGQWESRGVIQACLRDRVTILCVRLVTDGGGCLYGSLLWGWCTGRGMSEDLTLPPSQMPVTEYDKM